MSFLKEFWQKVQVRPEQEKARIMWVMVVLSALLVLIGWIFWVKYYYFSQVAIQKPAILKEVSEPAQELKESIPTLKEVFGSSLEVLFNQSQNATSVR